MAKKDVDYIFQKRNEYKQLLALRDVAIHYKETSRAAQLRSAADAIQLELYRKFDLII